MASSMCLDDLADLVLIELFSYLSSLDILWEFTDLNYRLTVLLTERRFFSQVNLSLAYCYQFNRILRFLPLNDIQSLSIDSEASPLQLSCWPYMPRLRTLCINGVYNYDELLIFSLLHAATLTHLIIKSHERLVPDGTARTLEYPLGEMSPLLKNILLIHLPALRSIDLGMNYHKTYWSWTTAVVPLTYLRLSLTSIDTLLHLMSTPPLFNTLRQLHVKVGNNSVTNRTSTSTSDLLIRMTSLHTFTLFQPFFSMLRMEWTTFENLTSSNVMPVLRRANVSIFIEENDVSRINSAALFTDHRHVDVNFAFNLINCPQYREVTQYIPRGNRFHPREIVGATLFVNHLSERSERRTDSDPYSNERQYYHHIWYTLPWKFDEFFHEHLPRRWLTKTEVFQFSSQTKVSIGQSSLRSFDASGQRLPLLACSLPHVLSTDRIETFHLPYYITSFPLGLSALRNLTLLNSVSCLNYSSLFPRTIRSIRILLFYFLPSYILPNWSRVLHSLSTVLRLSSLGIFLYDLPKLVDDESCETIAKAAPAFRSFTFCFRQSDNPFDGDELDMILQNYTQFIKQLCQHTLASCLDNQLYYSVEDDGCGLTVWF